HRTPPALWAHPDTVGGTGRPVAHFVSPSRFTAEMHAKRGFAYPVGHLPYFIDRVDEEWRQPGPPPQAAPYFLFVGRLETIKGLHTLIDAWAGVPEYDLLGRGRGGAAGHPPLKFLGPMPPAPLGAVYHHARACIVPSITYETFGMIIIEAFARKTPAIVRDLGALPEVVHDSGGGFTYRTDAELRAAIERTAGSPAERAKLGERGYQAFLRWWSRDAHLVMYFDVLRQAAIKRFGAVPWETVT